MLSKTTVVLLLVLGGALARRRRLLDAASCATLSRLVVDVTFPALVVAQLIRSLDRGALAASWSLPLLGALVLLIGAGVGLLTSPAFCRGAAGAASPRRTYVFLCSLPNWIFLPLLIVESLYGAAGVRAVLLLNVGALILLWTLGVWLLSTTGEGRGDSPSGLRALVRNPGLVATIAGVALAVAFPALGRWQRANPAELSVLPFAAHAVLAALGLLGQVTVPLSVFVTGGQLGGLSSAELRPDRPLLGVVLGRLALAPLALLVVGVLATKLGLRLSPVDEAVTLIVASMPVAVSGSLFVQRFGGQVDLAARAVLYSTLLATVSTPAFYALYASLAGVSS